TVHSPAKTSGVGAVMKYACLPVSPDRHSYHPSAGTRHRRWRKDGPNAFELITVSERALIIRAPTRASRAHGGTRPQRATRTARPPVPVSTTGTGSVGATL